jgi:hypothetical protein
MGLGSFFEKFVPPAVGKVIGKFIPFLSPILSTISIVSMALTWLRKPDLLFMEQEKLVVH